MGLEVAAITLGGLYVASRVGQAHEATIAAEQRQHALDVQSQEVTLQTQQKTLQNYAIMEKVLDAQAAHMTTTGTAFSSPSYNAFQRDTLNIGARKQRNIDTESALEQENIETEKRNVKTSLYSQLFGEAAEVSQQAFTAARKMPTTES